MARSDGSGATESVPVSMCVASSRSLISGFTRRRAQRQQLFLAVWRDSERRKDGNAHDALGHPNLQVEAV